MLDESQKQKLAEWVEQGLKLSDIQSKMASELGIRMTYMDLRFLLDDLGLQPKDQEHSQPEPIGPGGDSAQREGPGRGAADRQPPPGGTGRVVVTVDQVSRPGALVSGQVTFSDGKSADWQLDQMGRLGLMSKEMGYKPSQADLVAFQTELQNELARLGF